MRNEHQPGSLAQDQRRRVRAPSPGAEIILAVTLFVSVYLATFLAAGYAARAAAFPYHQWVALCSVIAATAVTIRILDEGRWNLGLSVRPRIALADAIRGGVLAALLIAAADSLVRLSTNLRHARGASFPWFEVIMVFAPAVLHEELAFRGYLFQKMRQWNRGVAIVASAVVFAMLHFGNRGLSAVAAINLILAGVLLALAYERYERLWFPIGIHLVWNVLSGPILGWGVSGYAAESTLFRTIGTGPLWLTGGTFGIEGSVWMGVVETGGIVWMWGTRRSNASAEL